MKYLSKSFAHKGCYTVYGPPLRIDKARLIKLAQSLIPQVIRRRLHDQFAEQTKKRMFQEDLSLFKIIHIETRTLCNGRCSFCPAAVQYKSRPDLYISRQLYSKIIDELQLLNYRGRLSPYCNNEPLIDERIYDFLNEARSKCPQSYLEIKTNGKTLTLEKLQRLIDLGLDEIDISDYTTRNDFSPNIKEIIDALSKDRVDLKKCKIIINWRKERDVLQNRAGQSPTPPNVPLPLRRFCSRPFEMITVGTEGQIGMCSSDFDFQHILGNIKHLSLKDAWHSPEYQRVRDNMQRRDRTCTVPCGKCDYDGFYTDDLKGNYRWVRWV